MKTYETLYLDWRFHKNDRIYEVDEPDWHSDRVRILGMRYFGTVIRVWIYDTAHGTRTVSVDPDRSCVVYIRANDVTGVIQ